MKIDNTSDDKHDKRSMRSTEQIMMNVPYGSDPAQTLDIYLPPNRSIHSTKIFVIIHGGGFNSGSKDELTTYIKPMQQRISDHAFFNISYRQATTPDTVFPTQENDVKTALQFIIDHSAQYCVSKKMILLGVSAGGLLALLHGYKYEKPVIPDAIISFFGPTDLLELYKHPLNPLVALTLQQVTGKRPDQDSFIYIDSSPVNFVTAQSPPTLLLQGELDPIVSIDQPIILLNKLNRAGVKNQFVLYPNEGHGWHGETLSDSFNKIEMFLKENVE